MPLRMGGQALEREKPGGARSPLSFVITTQALLCIGTRPFRFTRRSISSIPPQCVCFFRESALLLWHLTKRSWQSCQMCHCNGRPLCRGLSSESWLGSAGPGRGGLVAESSQRKSFDSGTCLLWQTRCACLDTMRVQDTWLLFGFPGGKALLFIWLNFWVVEKEGERECASGCIDLCLV